MKTSLEKLERNVKTDRAFVLILTVLTALLAVSMFIEGFSLMSKDAADFSTLMKSGTARYLRITTFWKLRMACGITVLRR